MNAISNPTSATQSLTTHARDILQTKVYGGELEAQLINSLKAPNSPNAFPDISDDDLARRCIREADHIVTRLHSLAPYLRELRERFRNLDKNTSIVGCATWTEFVETKLDKSMRQVQRVLKPAKPEDDTRHNVASSEPTPTGLTEEQLAYFDKEEARHDRVVQEYADAVVDLTETQLEVLGTYEELRDLRNGEKDEDKVIEWAKSRKGFAWAMERLGLPRIHSVNFPHPHTGTELVRRKQHKELVDRKKINFAKTAFEPGFCRQTDSDGGVRPRKDTGFRFRKGSAK